MIRKDHAEAGGSSVFRTGLDGLVSLILAITSSLFGLFAGRNSVARNGKKLTKYYEGC